jgi:RNA polymerase sigma-70 factor, ECF subfamily
MVTIEAEANQFERLYRLEGDRLWRAVLAFSGDPEIASDAVAEAFAQALRRGGAISDPRAWIWRASFKIANGELRDRRRLRPATKHPTYEMPEPILELVVALRSLTVKQRTAVVLHHGADYSINEVAEILGTTRSAVKVHLSRARLKLRKLLGDDHA